MWPNVDEIICIVTGRTFKIYAVSVHHETIFVINTDELNIIATIKVTILIVLSYSIEDNLRV